MTDFSSRRTCRASAAAEIFPTRRSGVRARKTAPLKRWVQDVIQKNWQELIRPNKLQVTAGADAEARSRRWSPSRSSAASA